MSEFPRPNRRNLLRIFVRRYQFRFVLANLVFFCLVGIASIFLLFGPLVIPLLSPSVGQVERTEIADAFLALHARIWLLIAMVGLVTTLRLAIVSHRVAGPLVNFTKVFRALKGGDVSMRVRLRRGDYLKPDAAELDAAIRAVRRRLSAAQSRAERLERAVERLRLVAADSGESAAAVAVVEEESRHLRMHLNRFRTRHVHAGAERPVPTVERVSPARWESGFTLIELLAVVAIIGTVAAIGFPMYTAALDAARVTRAIGDIKAISTEISFKQITLGHPPDSLVEVGFDTRKDPYGRPYVYLRIDNLKGKGAVRKDHKLNPINSDFDLYSLGKDGVSKTQVNQKDSLDDIIRANDGGFIGLARDF